MKIKRCAVLLLGMLLVFLLSGCGSQTAEQQNESESRTEQTTANVSGTDETAEDKNAKNEAAEDQNAADGNGTSETEEAVSTVSAFGRKLVVYFSATGNTKPIAEYAGELLNADLYEIVPEEPYTEDDLNYNDSSSRATVEQNDASARPGITGTVEHMEQYDTVIIAYPIWWGVEPKIIDTFIESYDFTGKTMTSLCTSGGSGIEASAANLQSAVPKAEWLESRRFETGADKAEVKQWLEEIGLME